MGFASGLLSGRVSMSNAARSAASAIAARGRRRPAFWLAEPLEPRRLLTGWWVTFSGSTSGHGFDTSQDAEPHTWEMRIKPQYDADGDGIAEVPVEAADNVAAIKKAIVGYYDHKWSRSGLFGDQSAVWENAVYNAKFDFPADEGAEFAVATTEDTSTGVFSGAIQVRPNLNNPYDIQTYGREHVDESWGVTADPRPHVWVEATDDEADEDDRDPATFAIKSEGGNPSQPTVVHFAFGGGATASDQPESAFPEGIAWNNEADFTVDGATADPNAPGYWTVTLSGISG